VRYTKNLITNLGETNSRDVLRKHNIIIANHFRRKITMLVQSVCHLAMLEELDSFWWRKLRRSYENAQHAVRRPWWRGR